MIKLSKSDKIDKEQEARDREFLGNPKVSSHFAVGTYISEYGKGRGLILDRLVSHDETLLRVQWEDGRIENTKPIALNR
jgi:hypothetical protein